MLHVMLIAVHVVNSGTWNNRGIRVRDLDAIYLKHSPYSISMPASFKPSQGHVIEFTFLFSDVLRSRVACVLIIQ